MGEASSHIPSVSEGDHQVCVLVVEDDPALQRMILNYFVENNIRTLLPPAPQEMIRHIDSQYGDLQIHKFSPMLHNALHLFSTLTLFRTTASKLRDDA